MTFPAWVKPRWYPKIEVREQPHGLDDPCWIWLGACTRDGYPVVQKDGRKGGQTYLHRESHEQHTGTLLGTDDGGHLCGRPPCFQPTHIERQTRGYNRGSSTAARYSTASHLPLEDLRALADGWWLKTRPLRHGA